MFEIINTYVESGQVTPQVGYLYLLIARGIKDKEELAVKINATVRTVERNFKILAELGLTYTKYGYYYATNVTKEDNCDKEDVQTTEMSPDLKAFKKQDKDNIYISKDKNVELKKTATQIAKYLDANPSRIEEAIKRALGGRDFDPNAAIEACLITKQRIKEGKVHSSVGYFCIVLRNIYRAGAIDTFSSDVQEPDKPCEEWEFVKEKLRSELGNSSFSFFIQPIKSLVNNKTLILRVKDNDSREWITKHYLGLIKSCWEGDVQIYNLDDDFKTNMAR